MSFYSEPENFLCDQCLALWHAQAADFRELLTFLDERYCPRCIRKLQAWGANERVEEELGDR